MKQPEAPATPAATGNRPLTVSQLAAQVSSVVSGGFPGKVQVVGEVSGFRDRTHWYFDLKDSGAVISGVMFAAAARRARFTPTNGQEVVATGRLEFYEKQGRITLLIDRLDPVGAGALDLALKALIEELRKLGWLEESRKRPMPTFARNVAVVTSRTGAALQDVIDTMRRRCPAVGLFVVDARVQGEGAAGEVASALRWLGRCHQSLSIDAVLVTRGGGSKEDLWAFNERIVAEAIVNSPVPVAAAIGHETDITVAELVADLRCATPTQAAMRLTPDLAALREQADACQARLRTAVTRDLRESRRHADAVFRSLRQCGAVRISAVKGLLDRLGMRLERHRPAAVQARRSAMLHSVETRLAVAMRTRLGEVELAPLRERLERAVATLNQRSRATLEGTAKRLAAVGPSNVLNRGFSYTMREDGTLVRAVSDARPGDVLKTTVSDGVVRSVVDPARSLRPAARPKPPMPEQPPDQMDLFGGKR